MPYIPKCNQCDSMYIQGLYCHETGCPNTNKVWDKDEEEWVRPEDEEDEVYDGFYDEEEDEEERAMDSIGYLNKEYPVRDVYIEEIECTANVSTDSLAAALNPNDDWDNITSEAEYIDNKIYFYVPDEMITASIKELTKYVNDNS